MLRGAGKVGSALVATQGEQLRLMACTSSIGAGVKAAQDVAEGLVATFMGSTDRVSVISCRTHGRFHATAAKFV